MEGPMCRPLSAEAVTSDADAAKRFPSDATIHGLFARQVGANPRGPAVTYEDQTLTYAELDERSSTLAQALAQRGAGPGERVGVRLERGVDLVVALLGVLKSGAAYVPLDPRHPAERQEFVVQDAELSILVSDEPVPGVAQVPVYAAPVAPYHPLPVVAPDSLAYVIYTSGSTGRPKGVLIPHRNVVALLAGTADDFAFGSDDVWTMFHSFAFDFSVWEMWGCLLTGGRLVVVPHWTSRDPRAFHSLLAAAQVTVLNQTPSAFAQLVSSEAFGSETLAVRLLVFGGEPLDVTSLAPWFAHCPLSQVENMYGITETTVHCTRRTLTPANVWKAPRSVGRPLDGWEVYILDEQGQQVPHGAPGEIYVGGKGLAKGYLNRPELTRERFVPDRVTHVPGRILYRSGDRGRLLDSGELEHLGRLDDQVQMRGFRVELGEIRSALTEDPHVRAAAVVARETASSGTADHLDAYVVVAEAGTVAGIRRRLAKRLPDYLMPTTITALDEMPLTPNQKIDVRRLPEPYQGGRSGTTDPEKGDDPLVGHLAALWQRALGVTGPPLRPEDNFFEVGGNSLLVARLGEELRAAGFGVIALRELYLHSSLSGMAELLRSRQGGIE
ncbi:amino acid adenylation domain-containing protein [Streptomyces tendae]|uniref:amino acid adenylation domain-containing protein n=1 Tax=Streptomyces tendae TaxID=1932 RepID=UPI0036747264